MTIEIITLNNPATDIQYVDELVALDAKVRENNASPYLYPQDRGFYQRSLAGETVNLLAFHQQQLVGYASLRAMDPWPGYLEPMSYPTTQCGLMLMIMVDPKWRGLKIGKLLNQQRLIEAKKRNWRYLFVTVHPHNSTNCHNLAKLGFKLISQQLMFEQQLLRDLMFLDTHEHSSEVTARSAAI